MIATQAMLLAPSSSSLLASASAGQPPATASMRAAPSVAEARQGQRREVKVFFFRCWPGEEGGWGQLGQFQRHVVGGGVNHLGGRRGGVVCGFSGRGDPCGERNTAFDSLWWCFGGEIGA